MCQACCHNLFVREFPTIRFAVDETCIDGCHLAFFEKIVRLISNGLAIWTFFGLLNVEENSTFLEKYE